MFLGAMLVWRLVKRDVRGPVTSKVFWWLGIYLMTLAKDHL